MSNSKPLALFISTLILAACATPPSPLPFDLFDKNNMAYPGVFRPADGSIEVRIREQLYSGFYVTSTSTAHTTDFGPSYGYRRYGAFGPFPADSWTVISNNSGKATLQNADGERLSCDFMFEGRRLLGECRSPQGATYQMVANQAPPR